MQARGQKRNRRLNRARKRVLRISALCRRASAALSALVFVALLTDLASAQTAPAKQTPPTTPQFTEKASNFDTSGLFGAPNGILGTAPTVTVPAGAKVASCTEVLRGNGTRAGYILSHGGVLPETVSLRVGVKRLRPGSDYWLDPSNGTLTLAESVKSFDSIDVFYKYVEGYDATRQPMSLPGLKLNFGSSTSLGLFYGMTSGNGNGLDASTYGLGLNSKFAGGGLSGLLYFSNAQQSSNVITSRSANASTPQAKPDQEAGSDHLIVQSLSTQFGSLKMRADYQDIGKKFAGFQAMKLNNAQDKAMLDQIGKLEGEKGVKRLGFGLDYAMNAKGKPPQGLALDWNQIQDEKGAITQQKIGFTSQSFRFNYDTRDVSEKFGLFKGLREADAAQWAHEAGMKTTNLGFGLNFGPSKKGVTPGALDFVQQNFSDRHGKLRRELWSLNTGALGFAMMNRHADKDFARLNDLSDADKTALALDIRRQYDPNATAAQVTAADKAQLVKESGLSRDSLRADLGLGKGSAFSFAQNGIKDEGGKDAAGLKRESLSLNTKNLDVAFISRTVDKDFTRLGDLSDADKTGLALDLYRQYDPKATEAQVTAADKAAIGKEAGFARSALRANLALNKTDAFSYIQSGVKDKSGAESAGFTRDSLALNTKSLELSLTSRKTNAAFTRIGDLADVEKNNLALDIRRQFDPNATLAQVTPKEREQVVKETGIGRMALRGQLKLGKGGKNGVLHYNQFAIAREPDAADKTSPAMNGAIHNATLEFVSRSLRLFFANQTIADNFLRLTDLSDLERAHFANEHGLRKRQVALDWDVNKRTKFTFASQRVGGTEDAVASALASAIQAGKDSSLAARAAGSGYSRENVTFATKGLNLAANFANTGKEFARTADLALAEPDKQAIERERGFQRSDYTVHYDGLKGLKLDSYTYSARDAQDSLGHDTYKQNLLYTPNKRFQFSFVRNGDLSTADATLNGNTHSLFTLNQNFGKGLLLNLYRDDAATYDKSVTVASAATDFLHFETDKTKPNALSFETKRIALLNDRFENTNDLNLHIKPSKQLSFSYSNLNIDRGGTPKDPSENTDSFDFQWQTTKQFAIVGGVSQKGTTNNTDVNAVSIGLQGQPFKNVTLTAKFDELHQEAKNTKDVADIAFSNSKPFIIGPIKELTVTARYAALNDQRKLQNETMTGRATWKLWKNDFVLDYGGLTRQDGLSTITRVYSFISDPNPKKWFHGTFLYKARTMLDGQEKLVRRFTADARLSKHTSFVYTYGTLPEDDKSNPQPITTADIALKHAFRSDLSGSLFYRLSDNETTKILTRAVGFSLEGQLRKGSKLDFAYSRDDNGFANRYDRSNHFRVGLEQDLDAKNYFVVSFDYRGHSGPNLTNEVQGNLDFRTRF